MFSLSNNPNYTALSGNVNNVLLGWCFRVSHVRIINIKYFDIDTTVSQLVNGEITRFQIKAIRNTNRRQGYKDREEFFNEVLRRFDLIRAEQKETNE